MALPILDGNQSATTLSTILSGGEHTPAHTVVSLGSTAISNITSAVSGSVVSVSNFPSTQTIAGTVTANVSGLLKSDEGPSGDGVQIYAYDAISDKARMLRTSDNYPSVLAVDPVSLPAISGTVTANVTNPVTIGAIVGPAGGSIFKGTSPWADTIRILPYFAQNGIVNYGELSTSNPFPVSQQGAISGTVTVGNSVTIGSLPAISGTVTVGSLPNGELTTRFGSVVTANLAFITSAVTNTSRKYLLAQNISTGTVTIGIGFSPTTTQGIQLPAGGGLTFDAFCPTGAVYWLGAVTGAAFTILEG